MEGNASNLIKVAIAIGACALRCDAQTRIYLLVAFFVGVVAIVIYAKYFEKKTDELVAKSVLNARDLYDLIYYSKDKSIRTHTFIKLIRNIVDTMALKYCEEGPEKNGDGKSDKLDWFLDASVKKDDFFVESVTNKEQAIENIKTLIRYKRAIIQLHKLSNIPYCSKNEEHEAKLMQLWKNLKPDTELKERLTE